MELHDSKRAPSEQRSVEMHHRLRGGSALKIEHHTNQPPTVPPRIKSLGVGCEVVCLLAMMTRRPPHLWIKQKEQLWVDS